jgi:hypothetical protein
MTSITFLPCVRRALGSLVATFTLAAAGCGSVVVDSSTTTSSGTGGVASTGSSGTSGTGGTGDPGTCPAGEPSPGSPCAPEGLSCTYTTCAYGLQEQVSCVSGTWACFDCITLPCPCSSFTTPSACQSDGLVSCRWLVPGCGATAFTPGCFDDTDCTLGAMGCLGGQTCTTVDADPCWDSGCATCSGLAANICYGPG